MNVFDADQEFPGQLLVVPLEDDEGKGGSNQGGAAVFLSFHGLCWIGPCATEEEVAALVTALGLTRSRRKPRPDSAGTFAKPKSTLRPPRLLKGRTVRRVQDRLPVGWTLWLVCNQDGLTECFILHSPDGWVVSTFSGEDVAVRFARTRAEIAQKQAPTAQDVQDHLAVEPKF